MIFWEKLRFEVFRPNGAQNEVFQDLWKINAWNVFEFLHVLTQKRSITIELNVFFWGGNLLVVGLKWDQIEVFWIFCSFFAESYSSIQYKLKNEVLDFFGKNLVLRSLDRVGPKERFSSIIKNQGTFHNFCMKA